MCVKNVQRAFSMESYPWPEIHTMGGGRLLKYADLINLTFQILSSWLLKAVFIKETEFVLDSTSLNYTTHHLSMSHIFLA